tara:strand:- start:21 stop:728 length:708 start_codon:yes stop_codon:yes gene_type:complete
MEVGHLFKKTLVIIPARKNSKGILNKNLIDINGKPLIDFTLKFISDNGLTQNTIISTDSTDILNYAKKYNLKNELRPSSLSKDNSSIIDVIIYEMNKLNLKSFKYILLLQPTSPLRKRDQLVDIFKKFLNNNKIKSVVSVTKLEEPHPHKLKKIENGIIKPFLLNTTSEISRQLLPTCYKLNGSFYISDINYFLKKKSFFSDYTYSLIMNNSESINIDSVDDLILFREKLKSWND